MTNDLQNRTPAPKVGMLRDHHNSRHHLSCSVGLLPTEHWHEFSALETQASSPS